MKNHLFIEPTQRNAEKCREALSMFGYDVTDISVEDLLTKKVLIRDYTVETDIHPFVKAASFEMVWKNKVKRKFTDFFVWFASLDDLIKMKRAATRLEKKNRKIIEKIIFNTCHSRAGTESIGIFRLR